MKLFMLIIAIACFSFAGCLESSMDYPNDIFINPKDDCGNVCGKINTNITNSSCDDPDKRNLQFLLIHDQQDSNEELTEYFDSRRFECVNKCPDNLQFYNESTGFCVKDAQQFAKDTANLIKKIDADNLEQSDDTAGMKKQQDDKFSYTWWIVGGVAILIVAVTSVIVGLFLKKRSSDNVDLTPPARPIIRL